MRLGLGGCEMRGIEVARCCFVKDSFSSSRRTKPVVSDANCLLSRRLLWKLFGGST